MRVFLALDLSEEQVNGLVNLQKKLKKDFNGVKWVDSLNLHVTLKFLGEIEEYQLTSLFNRVKKTVKGFPPFDMSLKGLGFFPNSTKPRIIWVGVEQGNEYVSELWKEIEFSLQEEGFPMSQKAFTPHVTLGRIRRIDKKIPVIKWINQYREFYLPPAEINHLTVYQSTLQPQGAIYTPLNKIIFYNNEGNI